MESEFVVETPFRFVGYNLFQGVGCRYAHFAHDFSLEHVGKHLGVESSCLIAFGKIEVGAECFVLPYHSELRQKFHESLCDASAVGDVHRRMAENLLASVGKDMVCGISRAAMAEIAE